MSKKSRIDTMNAAQLRKALDAVRQALAELRDKDPGLMALAKIEGHLRREFGIEPLVRCEGEAHSNSHTDNCSSQPGCECEKDAIPCWECVQASGADRLERLDYLITAYYGANGIRERSGRGQPQPQPRR